MLPIEKGTVETANCVVCPRLIYETIVADTVEMSNGRIDDMEILKRRISRVKRTPASGALKMPATAPAAPQPRRMVMLR